MQFISIFSTTTSTLPTTTTVSTTTTRPSEPLRPGSQGFSSVTFDLLVAPPPVLIVALDLSQAAIDEVRLYKKYLKTH